MSEFTFELKFISGRTELFYSFEDENPKSPSEYLNDNNPDQKDENFIDFIEKLSKRINKVLEEKLYFQKVKSTENNSTKYESKLYPVKRPSNGQNEIVYFSVKGLNDENEFQVYIYEEYIDTNKTSNTLTIVLVVVFVILTIVLVIGSFFAARYFRNKKNNGNSPSKIEMKS